MTIHIYRDAEGGYRWRMVERNGRIIATSGESYTRRRDAARAVLNVKQELRATALEGETRKR